MRKTWLVAVVVVCALAGLATGGCGSSSSEEVSARQLESARREGEEAAREKARIESLQHQVHHLQREVRQQSHPAAAATDSGAASGGPESVDADAAKTFHAPSGNVSCEIRSNGALCTVVSIGETFAFANGEEARVEDGAVLPRSAGELAPYGSTIEVGSITCSIPQSNEPRGISCADSASGHGFEASRISERQSVY